jgi:hypothetical protein
MVTPLQCLGTTVERERERERESCALRPEEGGLENKTGAADKEQKVMQRMFILTPVLTTPQTAQIDRLSDRHV